MFYNRSFLVLLMSSVVLIAGCRDDKQSASSTNVLSANQQQSVRPVSNVVSKKVSEYFTWTVGSSSDEQEVSLSFEVLEDLILKEAFFKSLNEIINENLVPEDAGQDSAIDYDLKKNSNQADSENSQIHGAGELLAVSSQADSENSEKKMEEEEEEEEEEEDGCIYRISREYEETAVVQKNNFFKALIIFMNYEDNDHSYSFEYCEGKFRIIRSLKTPENGGQRDAVEEECLS
jgi:hypothetical protein